MAVLKSDPEELEHPETIVEVPQFFKRNRHTKLLKATKTTDESALFFVFAKRYFRSAFQKVTSTHRPSHHLQNQLTPSEVPLDGCFTSETRVNREIHQNHTSLHNVAGKNWVGVEPSVDPVF